MIVVAVKPFDYQGCAVVPEDVCVVTPIEAAALVYQQQARFPDEDEAYGAYARRDLVPDTTAPRRRRTRRRDMTAAE